MEIVDVQHTYEELLETFRDGDGSVVNPLVRRCQSHEAEIARLNAALAAAHDRNTGPGTPHARLQWIGEEAAKRGIGKPFDSSRTPEQDVFEALDLARAECVTGRARLDAKGYGYITVGPLIPSHPQLLAYANARAANPLPESTHA